MLVSIQTVDMYWLTSVTYGQNFVAVRYHMVSGGVYVLVEGNHMHVSL